MEDIESWMEFHEARNMTSHVYDEKKAEQVLCSALEFPSYAAELLARLEAKK